MTYPNLSNEEILKLRDAISNTLSNMKKDIRKDKLKVLGKALLGIRRRRRRSRRVHSFP